MEPSGIAEALMGMTEAEKKRVQRRRAKKAGRCIVCRNRMGRLKNGRRLSTCKHCNDAAKERVRLYRQRKH